MKEIIFVWKNLSSSHKKKLGLLAVLTLMFSALEVLGMVSILPFLAVITNPEFITTNVFAFKVYNFFGFEHRMSFILAFGAFCCSIHIFRFFFLLFLTWYRVKLSTNVHSYYSRLLISKYVSKNYIYFINNNTSAMIKNMTHEVHSFKQVMLSSTEILVEAAIALCSVAVLFYNDPQLFLVGLLAGFAAIFALIRFTRGTAKKIGKDSEFLNRHVFSHSRTIFENVREIKIDNSQNFFIKKLIDAVDAYSVTGVRLVMLKTTPGIAMQTIAFVGFIGLTLVLLQKYGNFTSLLPMLGLFGLAIQRLMPAINSLSSQLIQLRTMMPALNVMIQVLTDSEDEDSSSKTAIDKAHFEQSIKFDNVTFAYSNSKAPQIVSCSFEINKGDYIGLIGSSGAGKTTVLNLILKLLTPTSGSITVDGKSLSTIKTSDWRGIIGYVPQNIILIDESITNNIAFGVDPEQIDHELVKEVVNKVNLDSLVAKNSAGLSMSVGEKGIKLSGGERQRIGIARALYKKPSLLVLDEATSALDSETEKEILTTLNSIRQGITIISVSHKFSTVRECERVIILERGKMVEEGEMKNLLKSSKFHSLLMQNHLEKST